MKKYAAITAGLAFINLYFGVLCKTRVYLADLLYLDGLFLAILLIGIGLEYWRQRKISIVFGEEGREQEKKRLLGAQIYQLVKELEEEAQAKENALYGEIQELTDYITKWAHEAKLPLSALRLMNERNPDSVLQGEMQASIERLQVLIHTVMMSGKLQMPENDLRLEKIPLETAVQEALKNQSYFLISNHADIEIHLKEALVYSDRRWLVYLLDQVIQNAIKYKREKLILRFWTQQISVNETVLFVEDQGIGIAPQELSFIFEKGYIGTNLRNGDYRSTGMGLYFARKIAEKLQVHMDVASEEGKWTRFSLHFYNHADFFQI